MIDMAHLSFFQSGDGFEYTKSETNVKPFGPTFVSALYKLGESANLAEVRRRRRIPYQIPHALPEV